MASTFASGLGKLLENINRTSFATNEMLRNTIASAKGEEQWTPFQSLAEGFKLEKETTGSEIVDLLIGSPGEEETLAEKIGRGTLGFAIDLFNDPLTYVGVGAMTKIGKLASKSGGLLKAGKKIEQGSKLARMLEPLKPEQKILGNTLEKQGELGQRAFLTFMGLPVGGKFLNKAALGFIGQTAYTIKNLPIISDAIKSAKNIFQATTGIPEYDDFIREAHNKLSENMSRHEKTLGEINSLMKGMKENEFKEIQEYMYGKNLNVGEKIKNAGDKLAVFMKQMADDELEKGVLKKTIDDYLPGILTEDALKMLKEFSGFTGKAQAEITKGLQFAKQKILTKEMTPSQVNDIIAQITGAIPADKAKTEIVNSMSKEFRRSLQGIKDISQSAGKPIKKMFITDPLEIAAKRSASSAKAIHAKELMEHAKQFGIDKGRWNKLSDEAKVGWRTMKGAPEGMTKLFFPTEIATSLERAVKPLFNIDEVNQFGKTYKDLIDFWKRWTLSIFPEYHVRNIVGNLWNNWIVTGLKDPMRYKQAALLRSYAEKSPDKIAKMSWVSEAGERITGTDIWKEMNEAGLISKGMFSSENLVKNFRAIPNPASNLRQGMQDVGSKIEDSMKMANYMEQRIKGFSPHDAATMTRTAMFDYSELTPVEKEVFRYILPFYSWCVPIETEVLTNNGWKFYNELLEDDMLLTYNIKTKIMEWQKYEAINVFDYNGYLLNIKNKRRALSFTPNHKWIIKGDKIIEGINLKTNHVIKMIGDYKFPEKSILTPKEAAILGWLVTDGYIRYRGNSMECIIYQSPKKFLKEIIELVGNWGKLGKIHPYTGVYPIRIKTQYMNNIRKYFKEKKDLLSIIPMLNKEAAYSMKDAMFKAEGSICLSRNFRHFAQSEKNKEVLDAFQILCYLTGEIAHLGSRGCYIKKGKVMKVFTGLGKRTGYEWYKGKVWCPTTSNGTWVMRYKGTITLTGNSRNNIPLQIKNVIQQPGKYSTIAKAKTETEYQAGTSKTSLTWMPEWMKENFPIILGRMNNAERYKVMTLMSWLPAGDLEKILSPGNVGQYFMGSLEPISKEILQQIAGKDFYLDQDIENYPGEMRDMLGINMDAHVAHALKSVRLLTFLNNLNPGGVFGEQGGKKSIFGAERGIQDLTPQEKVVKNIAGIRLYPYDVEKSRTREMARIGGELKKMQIQQMSARKHNQFDKVAELQKKIDYLKKKKEMK